MRPLRLVLVTRRFWPLVGGAESACANLAAELVRTGARVTILTAQWHADSPSTFTHRGVPVVRLANPAIRVWGTWRYMRAIERWLTAHRAEFDLACVSMLKHDAYAALGVGRRYDFPVLLRAEGGGLSGDVFWQLEANFGRRIKRRCMAAQGFVAPSQAIERELIAGGFARDRIHYIPNGVPVGQAASPEARREARAALGKLHPGLALDDDARLAVYTGRLDKAKGLGDLLEAWALIRGRYPDARLWLVGEGPYRDELYRQIAERNLDGRVVLPGAFDRVDDLLLAADMYVLPSWEEGMSVALLEAMAAGLPIVATDITGNQACITDQQHGLLASPNQPEALAAAIQRMWNYPKLANQCGMRARQRVLDEFSVARMAEQHRALFESVRSSK